VGPAFRDVVNATASALERAAARTIGYPYKAWGFGEAIAMLGLLAAWRVTGDARYRGFVESQFARWHVARGEGFVYADHVTPGVPLLILSHDDARWMEAALGLGRLFRQFPLTRAVPVHRPDLDGWSAHVWVDCLYTDGPFLALLSRVTGDATWQDLAAAHTLAYVDALRDPATGLFFHGFDAAAGRANAVRWGRGNGWALLGLVDLLRFLRDDHPARARLIAVVEHQIAALVARQDAGGHWHTVLDRTETYLEHSVTAMLAWAIPQAARIGLIADAAARVKALDAAARAFDAMLAATDTTGALVGVSAATPAGDLATYATQPTAVFPWGQGPLLLALADRIAPDAMWRDLW
jgi:unsaturated rhamnogalacturonyl hydrolase